MKQRIRDKRQKVIIDSAENIFFEKGYANSNLSEICIEANCSRTTVYTYFKNKENLYLAVVNQSFIKFLKYLASIEIKGKNGLESLLLYAKAYIDFSNSFSKHYQLMLNFHNMLRTLNIEEQNTADILKLKESEYFLKVRKKAEMPFRNLDFIIQFGQQDGSIKSKSESKILAVNLWSFFIGASVLFEFNSENETQNIAGLEVNLNVKNYYETINRILI